MSDQVKVYEIAEEVGTTSAEVISKASDLNINLVSPQSAVPFEIAEEISKYIMTGESELKKEDMSDEVQNEQKIKRDGLKIVDKRETKELEEKEKKLKQFHQKLMDEKDKFIQDKQNFEIYKQSEESKLKEKLLAEELNYKTKLSEERIKQLTQLKNDFLENIKTEYSNVNLKLDELTQKEIKLIQWHQELEESKKKLVQEKDFYEFNKEKILNEYKLEIEQKKEMFIIHHEEEKIKKQEEFNKNLEKIYQEKEKEITQLSDELIKRESELKIKQNELIARDKFLDEQEKTLLKEAQDKVEMEIKSYRNKIEHNETVINQLNEERNNLQENLNDIEKYEGRELVEELEEKRLDNIRLKKLLEIKSEEKNKLQGQRDSEFYGFEEQIKNLLKENQNLQIENKYIVQLQNENEKLIEKNKEIEYWKEEKNIVSQRLTDLQNLFSSTGESKVRIESIKKETYLKKQLNYKIFTTNEIEYLDKISLNMKEYGVEYPRRLVNAFHTALKCAEFSPLTVLSGVSGTGKSELPKLYSHFGGFNFLSEAVQPNWDSPESMIGFYNTIENKFDSTNILKFLLQTSQSKNDSEFGLYESMNMILLDEMNLSHIELYFAEFLSKFELRRGTSGVNIDIKLGTAMKYPIPLDKNLLWIGTMNEDETTKSLSDKVLDRSFAINFPRPDKLKSRIEIKKLEDIKQFEYLDRNIWDNWIQKKSIFTNDKYEIIEKYKNITNQINKELSSTGKAIGHRVWQSMEYYIQNHPLVSANINDDIELSKHVKLAFEEQLVQKVMPKLRGIETHGKEREVLQNINSMLNQEEFKITEDFELSMSNPYGQFIWNSANYLKED